MSGERRKPPATESDLDALQRRQDDALGLGGGRDTIVLSREA
jgi:hypothetical protein